MVSKLIIFGIYSQTDPSICHWDKWVFKNKKDKNGLVIKKKSILVAKCYRPEKWIDYDETFTHVARLEAIRMFLTFAAHKNFIVYQMDIENAFSNGDLAEELYVEQPQGLSTQKMVIKSMDKESPVRTQAGTKSLVCETLLLYLINIGFEKGDVDKILFKIQQGDKPINDTSLCWWYYF